MTKPILHYDSEQDILYLVFREGEEHHFDEVAEGIIVEFSEDDQPIGIEIFNASKILSTALDPKRMPVLAA